MADNRNIKGQIKLTASVLTIAFLEVSTDGGSTFNIVDQLSIPVNSTPTVYQFPTYANIDVSDPLVEVRIRLIKQTTTSTTTTTLPPSTTTTTTFPHSGNVFTLVPDSQNRLLIDNSNNFYQPGDTIQLRGTFYSVGVNNLSGNSSTPITITNYPGEVTSIGEVTWNGGAYSQAMPITNSHYLLISGEDKSKLIFDGSTQSAKTAYNIFYASQHTDNLEVANFTLRNGGTGFTVKTNPDASDATSYDNDNQLYNYSFHDFEIYGTLQEGLYIGHTATYWDLTANAPFYGIIGDTSTGWNSSHTYVRPNKLNHVKIFNGLIHDTGYDGIQTAAIDDLEVYQNEVYNYGTGEHSGDVSGICDGGRNTNTNFHDNIVHDGHGEFMYVFGSGGNGTSTHIIYNNLFYNNSVGNLTPTPDGVSIRGTDQLQVQVNNNTIATTAGQAIRINSYYETGTKPPQLINANALMAPKQGNGANAPGTIFDPQSYYYTENGGTYTLGTAGNVNTKFTTVAAANVDTSNYYQPNVGSPINASGYRRVIVPTTTSTSTTLAPTTSSTTTFVGTTTTTTTAVPTTTTTTTNPAGSQYFSTTGWDTSSPAQGMMIFLPAGYNPADTSTVYPWTVFLHGQGETGNNLTYFTTDTSRGGPGKYFYTGDAPTGYIVAIPQLASSYGTWEPVYIQRAINYMVANYRVDVNRMCLNGLSLGASGTAKYVSQNPDKVACYFTMTGDLSFIRNTAQSTINTIRVADVPSWYHAGIADATIDVGNVSQTSDILLGTSTGSSGLVSPAPMYPPNSDEYWGLGHSNPMWDDKGYNRKNRTDAVGTAVWDWIDWSKQFEVGNPLRAATAFVVTAENSVGFNEYLYALNAVNKLASSSSKTALLGRLTTVKSNIDAAKTVTVIDFGANTSTISNINKATSSGTGGSLANLVDFNGNNTGATFTVTTDRWGNGTVTNNLNGAYHGFDKAINNDAFRVYGTSNTVWTLSGLTNGSNYNLKFFSNDTNQNKTLQSGCNITIGATTLQASNSSYSTTRNVKFTNVTPTSGSITITMNALVSNWQGDITALVIEKVLGGTTTSSTTTTTTIVPTTSTSTTSSSTTSSTTTTTTITPTTSSTTTTTTLAPTTTTTTTVLGTPAKFNFALDSTNVAAGFLQMTSNPASSAVVGTQNGITITTVPSQWQNFGAGIYGGNDDGMSTGTFGADFPANVVRSYWLNYDLVYTTGNYNLNATGLVPTATYTIKFIGSVKTSVNPGPVSTEYHVLSNGIDVMQLLNCVDNTQNVITFTGVIPDGTGKVQLGIYKKGDSTGGEFGLLNGLIISREGTVTTTSTSTSSSTTSSTTTTTTLAPTTTSTTTTTTTLAPTTTSTTTLAFTPAKFGFSLDNTNTAAGFAKLIGHPATGAIAQTQNGVTVTTITGGTVWQSFSSIDAANDDGMSTGSFTTFPANIVRGYFLNYDLVFTGANYNVAITGLNAAGTYKIEIIASVKSSVNAGPVVSEFNLIGNGANQMLRLSCVDNVSTTVVFSPITPDGTGKIQLAVFKKGDSTGGTFGLIGGLIVTRLT